MEVPFRDTKCIGDLSLSTSSPNNNYDVTLRFARIAAYMSTVITVTGGARIGWVNASWPFARLTASPRGGYLSMGYSAHTDFPRTRLRRWSHTHGSRSWAAASGLIMRIPTTHRKLYFGAFRNPRGLIEETQNLGLIRVLPQH